MFDFALPDWELLCDSGEMSGDWELAVTKLKQINQIKSACMHGICMCCEDVPVSSS